MTIKTTLIALTAVASIAGGLALPTLADAQAVIVRADVNSGWHDRDGGWDRRGGFDDRAGAGLDARIDALRDRIDRGRDSGRLSRREADRLNGRLRGIIDTKRSYERSGRGLDGREVAVLSDRLDNLSADVHVEGRDGNRW
ncbi:hypothetical protein [Asticcacaulis solisilvae]|uniref:hypothetical protein n=1 Tax=Asticcacaulis solisilvae TaxID=1217274 RepID=UPI003FD84347